MNCKSCGYALWGLPSRSCPECGTAWKPSEYQFRNSAVRFQCVHCEQPYYGTGPGGHLEPARFKCIRCQNVVDMDEMVLLPTEGVRPEQTGARDIPVFPLRESGHRVSLYLRVVKMGLVNPGRLGKSFPADLSVATTAMYALIVVTAAAILGAIPYLMFGGLVAQGAPGTGMVVAGLTRTARMFAITIVGTIGAAFVWAAVAHGLLRLTGKTAGGIGRTFHAVLATSGANLLSVIPCLGWLVAYPWWVISAGVALAAAQKVGALRAALAVLTLPLLLLAGGVVWGAMPLIRAINAAGMGMPALQQQMTATTLQQLMMQELGRTGSWPVHGSALAVAPGGGEWLFSAGMAGGGVIDLGDGTTLQDLVVTPSRRVQDEIVAAAAARLPAGVTAHRVGDIVFTYHGVPADGSRPRLWVAVVTMDPAQGGDGSVWVVSADGSTQAIMSDLFEQMLAEQNAEREKAGLAPLPDVREVE